MATNWTDIIQIDRTWHTRQLNQHFNEIEGLLNVTLYTVKVSGTIVSPESISNELHEMVPLYVYGKKKIDEMGALKAGQRSSWYFGRKDPTTDGKYGELLLFALVESVLGCKMVSHKIRVLTNYVDQVKGSDGLFIGSYMIADGRNMPAYLIGESKVTAKFTTALGEALNSIDRFCNMSKNPSFLSTELIVASENMIMEDGIDTEELYKRLTPTTDEFREQILVVPIMLMFNSKIVNDCANAGYATPADLEKEINRQLLDSKSNVLKNIKDRLAGYSEAKKIHLHFFLVPHTDITAFRNLMYYKIHGVKYK